MAQQHVEASIYTCDNPGCGKEFIQIAEDELPYGYYLDVSHISGAGGDGAQNVFACKKSCILPALIEQIGKR